MPMTLADGGALPEPVRQDVHVDSFYKTSESRSVVTRIREVEFPTLLLLCVLEKTEGWDFLAVEYLTAIAALRSTQGWAVSSSSAEAFVLVPAR